MPHLVLEYSENLRPDVDVPSLLTALHTALGQHETVDAARVKSRSVSHAHFLAGAGTVPGAFMHVTVALLEGRSPDLLTRVGETLRRAGPDARGCGVTVEVREMKRALYFD